MNMLRKVFSVGADKYDQYFANGITAEACWQFAIDTLEGPAPAQGQTDTERGPQELRIGAHRRRDDG